MTHFLPSCLHLGLGHSLESLVRDGLENRLVSTWEHVRPIKLRPASLGKGVLSEVRADHKGMASCAFPTIINMSSPLKYCQPPGPSPCHQFTIYTRVHSTKPYQLRSTRMANTGPTSSGVASSATFEDAGPATDRPTLGKRSDMRKRKRGCGVLPEEVARKFHMPRMGDIKLIGD
jgi:hypothetical protein